MKKSDEKLYNDPWERSTYETGSTRPPRDRGGNTAVLLVAVILLVGIAQALGVVNIHMLRKLAMDAQAPDTLYLFDAAEPTAPVDETEPAWLEESQGLGLQGQTVTNFDRRFYELPKGVLVTDVAHSYGAHQAGVRAGDVIVSLNGNNVETNEQLQSALSGCRPGETVQLGLYRSQTGEELAVTITLSEEEE